VKRRFIKYAWLGFYKTWKEKRKRNHIIDMIMAVRILNLNNVW
jgi:hypothetical protein